MLKRDISTVNILVASAGGMIGSGWLFSPYISAQMAGSNALISWGIAAIFMLLVALPLCELGTMFPISGGMANYPTLTHGKAIGFLYAWTAWLSYVVMTPIEIQAILQYGSHFFPILVTKQTSSLSLSAYGYVAAVSIMLFVVILNTYGIKFLAEFNKYVSLIKFILPTIAIVMLFHSASPFSNVAIHVSNSTDWVEILSALSTGGVVFAFTGFQNGLVLAGEVKNPQRNIPIGILGAVLIGFLLYFMLQLSFIVAVPKTYLVHGWANLHYPGDSGPLVGLTLLLGLGWVASLLMIDATFSPFGTTLVYTAATSRIIYGMALHHHLPRIFLKVNRHKIPYVSLYVNFLVGILSFLPFPGWQKLVAFLSSASILSYGVGPICLLALRRLQPTMRRPFKLCFGWLIANISFYMCNLMLYWCGFDTLWKLNLALLVGLVFYSAYQKTNPLRQGRMLYWFITYMIMLLLISYYGSFAGTGLLKFPFDLALIAPFSLLFLFWSQKITDKNNYDFEVSRMSETAVVLD